MGLISRVSSRTYRKFGIKPSKSQKNTMTSVAKTPSAYELSVKQQQLRAETRQISMKLSEMKAEKAEYKSVIEVLEEQPKEKKAYHMIGAVLTQATVEEVLPNLKIQHENFEKTCEILMGQLQSKDKELRAILESQQELAQKKN